MEDVLRFGPFIIPIHWIVIGTAIIAAYFAIHYRLKRQNIAKDDFSDPLLNAFIITILTWKFSYPIFNPLAAIANPMGIIYFTGGQRGMILGVIIAIIYLYFVSKKKQIGMAQYIDCLAVGVLTGVTVYSLFVSLIFGESISFAYVVLALALLLTLLRKQFGYVPLLSKIMLIFIVGVVIIDYTATQLPAQSNVARDDAVGVQQGYLAPDFELEDVDGTIHRLTDYRGKKVIINFWATWCAPCRAGMPEKQRFYENYKDKDVQLISVNITTSERSTDDVVYFVKDEFQLTFPVLLDVEGKVRSDYQAFSTPTTYFIDTEGRIHRRIIGPTSYDVMESAILGID